MLLSLDELVWNSSKTCMKFAYDTVYFLTNTFHGFPKSLAFNEAIIFCFLWWMLQTLATITSGIQSFAAKNTMRFPRFEMQYIFLLRKFKLHLESFQSGFHHQIVRGNWIPAFIFASRRAIMTLIQLIIWALTYFNKSNEHNLTTFLFKISYEVPKNFQCSKDDSVASLGNKYKFIGQNFIDIKSLSN